LQSIRVFTVSAVSGSARRLDISCFPGLRAYDLKECCGVEGACADLDVIGLKEHAAFLGPERIKGLYEILEMQS